MIGYTTVGSSDLEKSVAFYAPLLSELGAKELWRNDRMVYWGTDMAAPGLGICTPYDGNAPSTGNGAMVALMASSKGLVEQIHAKAVGQGGIDEGAPGFRGAESQGFYGAYFRDLDGNKICVFSIVR